MSKKQIIFSAGCLLAGLLAMTAARGQSDSTLRFCLTGDVMLGRGVKRISDKQGAGYPFAATCSLTTGADLTIGNLESPLTSAEYQSTSPWHFRGDTCIAATELKTAGFGLVSLANNHALDCGPEGLSQCAGWLDSAGIPYAGLAYVTMDSSGDTLKWCRPVFLKVKGKKIGMVAFCEPYLLEIAKGYGAENIAPAESACVARSITAIRDSCDLIIASFHWGQEYQESPSRTQKKLGRLAIDCGARIVHGHHPHVLQGVEFYRNGLIAYSLGNFIFDQKNPESRESALLFTEFRNDSLALVLLMPLEIANNRPQPAGRKGSGMIKDRLLRLCRKRGTQGASRGSRLFLKPAAKTKAGKP